MPPGLALASHDPVDIDRKAQTMTATTTATYFVSGMTCEHCVHAVTTEFSALDGVLSVAVDLAPNSASAVTVSSTEPLDPEDVREAVDEAGYDLASEL